MTKVVRTTITIEEDLLEQFKTYSKSQDRSVSAQISAIVKETLKKDLQSNELSK
jgi:hypothetical protein